MPETLASPAVTAPATHSSEPQNGPLVRNRPAARRPQRDLVFPDRSPNSRPPAHLLFSSARGRLVFVHVA